MPPRKPATNAPKAPPTPRLPSVEEAAGSAFVPTDGAVARGARPPKLSNLPAFLYVYNPDRWFVLNGQVLPDLGRMVLTPGVNGVDQHKRADGTVKILAGAAKNSHEERGRIVIPPHAIPPHHARGGVMSYLWQPNNCPGVTLSIYSKCYPGSDVVEPDLPAYCEFLNYLIDSGTVPPPSTFVLRKMIGQLEERAARLGDKVQTMPSLKPQHDAVLKELDAVKAKLAEREEEVTAQAPSEGTAVEVDA